MADCQLEEQKHNAQEIDGHYIFGKEMKGQNEVWQNDSQQPDSAFQIGKESSFNELIQKWEAQVTG